MFCYNTGMTRDEIIEKLLNDYPNPACELNYNSNFSLLVAVILSAQCTDKRVNMVTPILFEKYKDVYEMANANLKDVESIIKPCGFYHNKAKSIIECAKKIVEEYDGNVPNTREALESLSGVGRKTANVILSLAFNEQAIAVDTHVFRVSQRLGLCKKPKDVFDCEKQLMRNIPKQNWTKMHYILVLFGRYKCKAISPLCDECAFKKECRRLNGNTK